MMPCCRRRAGRRPPARALACLRAGLRAQNVNPASSSTATSLPRLCCNRTDAFSADRGGTYSWNDFADTLNAIGHHVEAVRVPADVYDGLYPGAHEVRETLQYFAEHTYFGPRHEAHIRAANALVSGGFTSFADWAPVHMKP